MADSGRQKCSSDPLTVAAAEIRSKQYAALRLPCTALFCQRPGKLFAEFFGFLQFFFRWNEDGAESFFKNVGFKPFQPGNQIRNRLAAPAVGAEYQYRALTVIDSVNMA